MNAKQDIKVSQKINAIRKAAGNPGCVCPLCGQKAQYPYRRFVDGKVYEGCVDAFHTEEMNSPAAGAAYGSATVGWHNREVARQMRKDELVHLMSL